MLKWFSAKDVSTEFNILKHKLPAFQSSSKSNMALPTKERVTPFIQVKTQKARFPIY